jgi:hypothetical protein
VVFTDEGLGESKRLFRTCSEHPTSALARRMVRGLAYLDRGA